MPLEHDPIRKIPANPKEWDEFFRKVVTFAELDSVGTPQLQDNAVTNVELRDSVGVSVIGRSVNSSGDPADIVAAANGQFFARRSDVLGFAALGDADIPATIARDAEVTAAVAAEAATTASNLSAAVAALNLASGTYTPTLVNVANAGSITAFLSQYLRVGVGVSVSGKLTVTATAGATPTQIAIPLPVASNIANAQNVAGMGVSISGLAAAIYGDAMNNRAIFEWLSTDTSSYEFFYTFTYQMM